LTSTTIAFIGPRQVELAETSVPDPGTGQIVIETVASLISTGTELTAYSGDFPSGSVWSRYIRYPWQAGYSNVGRVVKIGKGVTDLQPDERRRLFSSWAAP
jgi:NADPH:quinone reductase-like Zn-dependent oxidoreductase